MSHERLRKLQVLPKASSLPPKLYISHRLYTAERDLRAARLLHSGRAARAVPLYLLQPRACGRHRFSGGEVI